MKVGDKFKIPKELCGHTGKITWISEDRKTIAVRCSKYHKINPIKKEQYTGKIRDGLNKVRRPIERNDITYIIELNDSEPNL